MNLSTEKIYYSNLETNSKNSIVINFLKCFRSILENNDAVIAGGFARAAYLYMKHNRVDLLKYLDDGDIDIFFTSNKNNNELNVKKNKNDIYYELDNNFKTTSYKDLEVFFVSESYDYESTFSKNFLFDLEIRENQDSALHFYSLKTQMITALEFNSYEDLFYSFDFQNSRYAMEIDFENKFFKFVFDKEALNYDLKKEIMIANPVNNLLGYRISKYLNRGCDTISKDSLGNLKTYIKKLSTNEIVYVSGNIHEKDDVLNGNLKLVDPYCNLVTLNKLYNFNLVKDSELLYFLGKWFIDIYGDIKYKDSIIYSHLGTRDWAVEKIKEG